MVIVMDHLIDFVNRGSRVHWSMKILEKMASWMVLLEDLVGHRIFNIRQFDCSSKGDGNHEITPRDEYHEKNEKSVLR